MDTRFFGALLAGPGLSSCLAVCVRHVGVKKEDPGPKPKNGFGVSVSTRGFLFPRNGRFNCWFPFQSNQERVASKKNEPPVFVDRGFAERFEDLALSNALQPCRGQSDRR